MPHWPWYHCINNSGGGSWQNQVGLTYYVENISTVKKLKSYGTPLKLGGAAAP